jgi:hypothetical protein
MKVSSSLADGYFAEPSGNVDEQIVHKYIRDQQW